MKITYLVHQFFPEYFTGTEKFILKMSSMMQKAGHSVRVITYSFQEESLFDKSVSDIIYREYAYKGVPVIAMRHKETHKYLHLILGNTGMASMVEYFTSIEKPDIVHVGHPMRINEFITAYKSMGVPYIITLTDFWLICPRVNLVNLRDDLCAGPEGAKTCKNLCPDLPYHLVVERLGIARGILEGAQKVISPSKFLADIFKKELENIDITVINHGMSNGEIKQNNRKYEKGDKLIFCYAGTLDLHKGIHILIDAFKKVKTHNAILKIYGSGYNPEFVNKLYDMAKNDKRIEFCNVFPEGNFGDVFSNVDVVIVPSKWYENYPLILHEALVCNVPVIASNVGGMAEKIKDGVNGFTFQIGDAHNLRKVIEKVAADAEILNDLKKNIKSFLIPTVEQEAHAYNRIYTSIKQ